jgi:type I restriction-modification system DNA methylase subunit
LSQSPFGSLIPQGKAGENTWNARLANKLRDKGFETADFEIFFPVLKGLPRKPDVAFTNGGTHLVSGKLGANKEFDAFSSAQEYQQLIGATTNLGEVFAVVYPSSRKEAFILHLLANERHERKAWSFKGFDDVADTISEVVQERLDELKRPVEPPDAAIVRLLRQGVEVLHIYAKKANEEKLKQVFGGADFFDSMLSESVEKEDRKNVLSRAAAFLFVNQILFYHILQREISDVYPSISPNDMSSPQAIREKYFSLVLEKDYRPIFELDVASLFDPERSMDGCLRVTRLIQELARSVSTHDLIGKVFHEIIPLEFRKLVAAFYTNSAAGDLLAELAIEVPDAKVLDPACGSGTLLVAAYHRKMQLAKANSSNEQIALHRRFVENEITGLDVMAFSAHLAAVQLLLQEPLQHTENLRIGTIDSTQVEVGMKIEPFGETLRQAFKQRRIDDFESGKDVARPWEVTKGGAVSLSKGRSESFGLTKVDLVIMNPPFTSSRRLPADYKTELKEYYRRSPKYEKLITGNIGYHVYFLCLADHFLEPGGRMAVVMPFTTLIGGDFAELTRFLVTNYSIEYVICGQGRMAYSENTLFSEVMLVAKKEKPSSNQDAVLLLTKTSPTTWTHAQVESLVETARNATKRSERIDTELCIALPFEQTELLPERKMLTRLVADLDEKYSKASRQIRSLIEESGLFPTVKQLEDSGLFQMKVAEVVHGKSGTGPGHSLTRFGGDALVVCRTEDRSLREHDRLVYAGKEGDNLIIVDKATKDRFEVPKAVVVPALRRFSYIDTIDMTGMEDFVIRDRFAGAKSIFDKIISGKRADKTYDDFRSDEWRSVVDSGSSTFVFPGRINLAAPGSKLIALRSNKSMFMCSFMWGLYGLSKEDEKILVMWMNSALFFYLLLSRQTVTGGSWVKFHGKQLKKIEMLDPRKLTSAKKERLVSLYDKLSNFKWPSLIDQYSNPIEERLRLDLEILRMAGVDDKEEAARLRQLLYDAITSSLKTMKETLEAK